MGGIYLLRYLARSSRTNFQVFVLGHQVLVLVLEARLFVLDLVLESQVLDNNTGLDDMVHGIV